HANHTWMVQSSDRSDTYYTGSIVAALSVASACVFYDCITAILCCWGHKFLLIVISCFDIAFIIGFVTISVLSRPSASLFCDTKYYSYKGHMRVYYNSPHLCNVQRGAYGSSIVLV